jgi:cyclase
MAPTKSLDEGGHMLKITPWFLVVSLVVCAATNAQENKPADSVFSVTHVNDHLCIVESYAGFAVNFVVSFGPDGVLLVDAGRPETADRLVPFLDSLTHQPVNYVISTHSHDDHAGGNRAFGPEVRIVADSAAASRMSAGFFALPPLPGTRRVDITITKDTTWHFNGEEIRLTRVPKAHTEGDLMVHFVKSRLLCVGDLLFAYQVPFVDLAIGGSPQNYVDNIKRLADTLAPDITIVPGHGPTRTVDDIKVQYEMLSYTVERVKKALAAGETAEQVLQDPTLAQWASWSHTFQTTRMEYWIPCLFRSLKPSAEAWLPSICDPMTRIIMSSGVDSAVSFYKAVKTAQPPQYSFGENELNNMGYELMYRQMMSEAKAIFQLNVAEHPESGNVYDSMGEFYMNNGERALAIQFYRKSLEKDAGNANAVEMLKRLESGQ